MSQVPSATRPSEPLDLCLPEDVAAGAAPPSPAGAPASSRAQAAQAIAVQPFRSNDAERSWVGARVENGLRTLLEQVPPGSTLQYGMELTGRAELAGELAGKVKVKHAHDGSYAVTVQNRMGAGVGLGAGQKAADGFVGLKGEVTLRFASADEAADRLAALYQTGLRGSHLGVALSLTGALDADSTDRARAAADSVKAFELGAYGQLKGKLDAVAAGLNLKAMSEPRVRVDVERGTVSIELSRQLGAKLKGPEAKLGRPELALKASLSPLAELEHRDTLSLEVKLRPEELAGLRQGRIDAGALLEPSRMRATLVQELSGQLGGVHVQARRELAVQGALPEQALALDSSPWEVHASLDGAFGGELKLETGVVDLKGELRLARPLFPEGTRTLALGELDDAVLREVQEQQREDALVHAQLAASRSR